MKYIIICMLILLIMLPYTAEASVDEEVRRVVLKTDKGFVDDSMSFFSRLGDKEVAIPLMLAIPDKELRKDAFLGVSSTMLITEVIKCSVGKTRPNTGRRDFEPFSGYKSFPSGHATGAFALATAVSEHYPKYKVYVYTIATLVAVSRLYEDKHWITDVAVGSAIGHYGTKFVLKKWKW